MDDINKLKKMVSVSINYLTPGYDKPDPDNAILPLGISKPVEPVNNPTQKQDVNTLYKNTSNTQ